VVGGVQFEPTLLPIVANCTLLLQPTFLYNFGGALLDYIGLDSIIHRSLPGAGEGSSSDEEELSLLSDFFLPSASVGQRRIKECFMPSI
jgi:hypothetical protein